MSTAMTNNQCSISNDQFRRPIHWSLDIGYWPLSFALLAGVFLLELASFAQKFVEPVRVRAVHFVVAKRDHLALVIEQDRGRNEVGARRIAHRAVLVEYTG